MATSDTLLVTVDGLRYDRLSGNGYERETTPRLDEVARHGASCETTMATGTGTLLSFPGILTSSYPLMYGGYARLTDDRVPIASVFRSQGYATLGVNTNAQLHPTFGWDRGFDVYVDNGETFVENPVGEFSPDDEPNSDNTVGSLLERAKTGVYRRLDNEGLLYRALESAYRRIDGRDLPHPDAATVVDTVADAVDRLPDDDPSFVWVHFMETHSPYLPPAEYRDKFLRRPLSEGEIWRLNDQLHEQPERLTDDDVACISDLYDASLRYLDDQIDRLLREIDLDEDRCLAVTSDHGEEFREHGGLTHCSQPYDEGIHVPLLFDFPRVETNDVRGVTSTLDIAPTLVDIATDADDLPDEFYGESLAGVLTGADSLPEDRVAVAELASNPRHDPRDIDPNSRITGCRTTDWKYATSVDPDQPDLLFDLTTDPGEQENIADEHPEVVARFDQMVTRHYDRPAYTEYDLEFYDDVSDVENRLEALGYVEE